MKRTLLPAVISLGVTVLVWAQARTAADVDAEPHHHRILENDLVRVFAVTLPPSQEVYVRHQHNFLTVTLQGSRMLMWSEGTAPVLVFPVNAGDTRFFIAGASLGMRNDGTSNYRNITVEFLDPQVTHYGFQYNRAEGQAWDYGSSALAPPVDAQSGFVHALPLQRAVVRDVRLLPGNAFPPLPQPAKELLIAVSDLNLTDRNNAGLRKSAGEIAWLEKRTSGLVNQGTAPARFVAVELK